MASLSNGNYYASYGGNTINITVSGAPTTTVSVTSGGCTVCPAPTPAPVTPAPVTPAPVTPAPVTPAPTSLANVTVYAKLTSTSAGKFVWYSTDNGSTYVQLSSTQVTTTCNSIGSFNVASGTTVIFLISTAGQANNLATAGNASATCPSTPPGTCQSFSYAVSGTQNIALLGNVAVSGC